MTKENAGKVGILTGGGDCPGLNAVIRAVVVKAHHADWSAVGILEGWKGLYEMNSRPLSVDDVEDLLLVGGTIIKTSRTNPNKLDNGIQRCGENINKLGLTGLVAIGGDDTLGVAAQLAAEGFPVVGVPKTIDNDLMGTDYTFGFDTAVTIATDAIDRLRTTGRSHDRTMVIELMGRHAGWIATFAAIAGGADIVSTPEKPLSVDEICNILKKKRDRGRLHAVVVVAEGAEVAGLGDVTTTAETDAFGHKRLGGIGEQLAAAIQKKLGADCRSVNLGHVQRGGSPTATDRILSTSYGLFAMKLVLERQFGKMVGFQKGSIVAEDLQTARKGLKLVPDEIYSVARHFFF